MSPDEESLRRLADIEELRRLKADYCHWSDRGYDGAGDSPAEVAKLFTEDGAWGDAHGRDAIVSLFEDFQRQLPMAVHIATNARIDLDGDRASARWTGMIPARLEDGQASWTAGVYDDDFVRTADGWRFTRLVFTPAFFAPHSVGW